MKLSYDALKILKYVDTQVSTTFEDISANVRNFRHEGYNLETISYLDAKGMVVATSERVPEGSQVVNVRITPAGQAELQARKEARLERWIPLSISISALIVALLALLSQLGILELQ